LLLRFPNIAGKSKSHVTSDAGSLRAWIVRTNQRAYDTAPYNPNAIIDDAELIEIANGHDRDGDSVPLEGWADLRIESSAVSHISLALRSRNPAPIDARYLSSEVATLARMRDYWEANKIAPRGSRGDLARLKEMEECLRRPSLATIRIEGLFERVLEEEWKIPI
jgi:hypothetical protein